MQIIEGAESFLLEGKNNKAVLLLHGYTGARRKCDRWVITCMRLATL